MPRTYKRNIGSCSCKICDKNTLNKALFELAKNAINASKTIKFHKKFFLINFKKAC